MALIESIGRWLIAAWNGVQGLFKLSKRVKELEEKANQRPRRACDSCGGPMKIANIIEVGQHWERVAYQCENAECIRHTSFKSVQQQTSYFPDPSIR